MVDEETGKLARFCCYKERFLSKSDISLHFGIRALCTGAVTWSLTTCQRGLKRARRCMKKPTEFATHAWTSVLKRWSRRQSLLTQIGNWWEHNQKYQTLMFWRSKLHDRVALWGVSVWNVYLQTNYSQQSRFYTYCVTNKCLATVFGRLEL